MPPNRPVSLPRIVLAGVACLTAALSACEGGTSGGAEAGADAATPRPDRVCEPPPARDACPGPTADMVATSADGPTDASADMVATPADGPTDASADMVATSADGSTDAAADMVATSADGSTDASAHVVDTSADASSEPCPDAGGADARPLTDCPELPDAAPADAGPARAWNVRRLFSDADGLSAPDGLHRMADGRVLVANQVTGDLQVIDPVAGTVGLFALHFPGLSKPEETADAPDGAVYVSDNVSRRVHRIELDGTHSTVLGPADGLVEPKGLAVRPDGTLVIADEGASRIVAFTPGQPLVVLADPDRGAASPESLQLAPDGTLYCTDDHQGGVLRITADGAVDQFLSPQQVRWADAVSVSPAGDLWFSEANPNTGPRLLHYSSAGVLLDTIAVPGPGRMLGVAALADGRVLTAFYQAPYVASEIWVAEPAAP